MVAVGDGLTPKRSTNDWQEPIWSTLIVSQERKILSSEDLLTIQWGHCWNFHISRHVQPTAHDFNESGTEICDRTFVAIRQSNFR